MTLYQVNSITPIIHYWWVSDFKWQRDSMQVAEAYIGTFLLIFF